MSNIDRRRFLFAFAALAWGLLPGHAFAKDGESGGGGSNSGSGGGGGDDNSGSGGGGSNSGSGGGGGDDNSGSGGGDDSDDRDSDDRDDRDDDDDNDSSSGSGSSDQEKALKAYRSGKVASLRKLKAHLRANYPGAVLKIDLKRRSGRYEYRVKMLEKGNRVKSVTLDGLTLQVRKR